MNEAYMTITCTEVDSSPCNRRIGEAKHGEHVRFSNGLYLFLTDPNKWDTFKVGMKYELRLTAL